MSTRASSRASSTTSMTPSVYRVSRLDHPESRASRRTSHHRPSISHYTDHHGRQVPPRTLRLANTYRMEPDTKNRFQPGVVEKMLGTVLESFLDGELYEAYKCAHIAENLTEVIKARMKELPLPRYKFVVYVMIGQNVGQSVNVASRSLWNSNIDNFASATYCNASLFAVAVAYAAYSE